MWRCTVNDDFHSDYQEKHTLGSEFTIYPSPCIQKKTGCLDSGVASDGAQTFKKRQSSLAPAIPPPTPSAINIIDRYSTRKGMCFEPFSLDKLNINEHSSGTTVKECIDC